MKIPKETMQCYKCNQKMYAIELGHLYRMVCENKKCCFHKNKTPTAYRLPYEDCNGIINAPNTKGLCFETQSSGKFFWYVKTGKHWVIKRNEKDAYKLWEKQKHSNFKSSNLNKTK